MIAAGVLAGDAGDPKAVEFLDTLTEKTAAGKIAWAEWQGGLIARLPNNVLAFFSSSTKPPYQWTDFSVQVGKDIVFRTRKTLPDSLLLIVGSDPVQAAANALFALITGRMGNPLDKAIESLKTL